MRLLLRCNKNIKIVLNKFFIIHYSISFTHYILRNFSPCSPATVPRSARSLFHECFCAFRIMAKNLFLSSISENSPNYLNPINTKNRRQILQRISGQILNDLCWNGFRTIRINTNGCKKHNIFAKAIQNVFMKFGVDSICLGHTFFVRNLSGIKGKNQNSFGFLKQECLVSANI